MRVRHIPKAQNYEEMPFDAFLYQQTSTRMNIFS